MEDVSQLMDGECEAGEAVRELIRIKDDPERREALHRGQDRPLRRRIPAAAQGHFP